MTLFTRLTHYPLNRLINGAATFMLFIIATLSFTSYAAHEEEEGEQAYQGMSQERMENIVRELASESSGQAGAILFVYNSIEMQLISDVTHNRMRIITPIGAVDDISQEELYAMMISNYHLALDARYAFGNDILYSVYIHPLNELNAEQIHSAVRQVASLAATFGSEYSSGELSFGAQQRGQQI